MTLTQQIITIAMVVLGTMITRFLPFLIFPAGKETPKYIQYVGKVLPAAVFGLLVVYCLRSVDLFSGSRGLPEAISIVWPSTCGSVRCCCPSPGAPCATCCWCSWSFDGPFP